MKLTQTKAYTSILLNLAANKYDSDTKTAMISVIGKAVIADTTNQFSTLQDIKWEYTTAFEGWKLDDAQVTALNRLYQDASEAMDEQAGGHWENDYSRDYKGEAKYPCNDTLKLSARILSGKGAPLADGAERLFRSMTRRAFKVWRDREAVLAAEMWTAFLCDVLLELGVTLPERDDDGDYAEVHGPVMAMFHGQSNAEVLYHQIYAEAAANK